MTRISEILLRVRDALADHDKQRWSDARLLRLVDDAQKDIARHSRLLKGEVDISLSIDVHTYDLPDDLHIILRASYAGSLINLSSFDEMDEQAARNYINDDRYDNYERNRGYSASFNRDRVAAWEMASAAYIDRLIYDNRDLSKIRVYPIPNEGIADNEYTFQNAGYLDQTLYPSTTPYGVLTGVTAPDVLLDEFGVTVDADSVVYLITDPNSCNGVELVDDIGFNSPYGLVAEIEDNIYTVGFHGDEQYGVVVGIDNFTLDSVYGVVADLYSPDISDEEFKDVYGVVTGINEARGIVRIWYVRLPAVITSANDDLELPRMYDAAIRYYVIAHAFADDNDAAFREKSDRNLQLYDRELQLAKETSSIDGVSNTAALTTSYRGPFE